MRLFIVVAVAFLLLGCSALSLAPLLESNANSYHQVVEDVTNSILVTNILRARDHAPLHYSDLAIVNGSLQGTASTNAIFPFGPLHPSSIGGEAQAGPVTLQTTPSFTLGTLDTDDFTRGILTPVAPDVIKYFLDQGLNPKIAFLIFFEAVRGYDVNLEIGGKEVDTNGKVDNAPDNELEFKKFLAIANYEAVASETQGLYANTYREMWALGKPFTINMNSSYKDIAGLDFTKVRLVQEPATQKYQLYSIAGADKVVFCRHAVKVSQSNAEALGARSQERFTPDGYRIFGLTDTVLTDVPANASQLCRQREVVVATGASPSIPVLYPRSPQGILEYLGAILRFQDRHPERRPITLSEQPDSGALFALSQSPADARFTVSYRGKDYHVAAATPQDHTLEVLALVEPAVRSLHIGEGHHQRSSGDDSPLKS
jgi:hypothetical protein